MTLNSIMGIVSTVSLSLPVVMLITMKLYGYRSFPALLLFYAIAVGNNFLTEGYINADPGFIRYYGIINNLLEAPLILSFLTYFSTSPSLTRRMKIIIAVFVVYEIIIIAIMGFTVNAITITIGSGLLLILGFCSTFFMRQTRVTIMYRKATGKALMLASLLFVYGCFAILYLMFYIFRTPFKADSFLIFFLATTISSLLMCLGISIERKRVQKVNELITTRKELSVIYNETKTAVPLRTAILDFDKDQWN
jgi:hypothetical protein